VHESPVGKRHFAEIVFADDAVAVLDQINQQIEYLRLDGNGLRTVAQLAPVSVKGMIIKEKLHGGPQRQVFDTALKE